MINFKRLVFLDIDGVLTHVNRWYGLTDDDIEKAKEILNICES